MNFFGRRASRLMMAASAVPTALAGWWIARHRGAASAQELGAVAAAAVALSVGAALLAWRWFAAPLRELERGLERWTRGDHSTPLDASRMAGWPGLAEQFFRAQEDLRRLDAMKEEFYQSAAHDLRAPLFAIQGYLRLLRKSLALDARQAGWFDAVDTSCDKLMRFVADALDFARLENGQMSLNPAPIDARALARRSVTTFRPLADERGIALDAKGGSEAVSLDADEGLIERLLQNLVGNALKFTPRGGHAAVWAAPAGDWVELAVEDDGPGIPEEQRAAIFDRFHQLESPSSASGFGLGLAICAKIVKLHGGTIWVEPAAPHGARFVARLPRAHRRG
jgi:signal transduction histidine kinase